jgi:Nuclease-related domain
VIARAHRVNYARRQQYRRPTRAGEAGTGAVGAALVARWAASVSAGLVAGCLLTVATALGPWARYWLSLARRSRVGARSEDAVQRALAPLQAEGWRLRHSLPWRGPGDIDSVAISSSGIAVAIETKTSSYD